MYLDCNKRKDLQNIAMRLHGRESKAALDRIASACGGRLALALAMYMLVCSVLSFWWDVLAFLITMRTLFIVFSRANQKMAAVGEGNEYELWCKQVEELDVDPDEQAMFLLLLREATQGSRVMFRPLLSQVMRSPKLSSLVVIQKLHEFTL